MKQQAKTSLHSIATGATNFGLPGLFFSALRFMVAVIFKALFGALSAVRDVWSNRVLGSVSLYLIGEGFVMGGRSGSH
jgi:hypothetical protein